MKYLYKITIIGLLLMMLSSNIFSKNYAILLSGGYGIKDANEEACYWYELVLAYEYLIEKAGYNPDDIHFQSGVPPDCSDIEIIGRQE